jgi:hypothetical protein
MKKRNIHDYSEDIGLDASRNVWTKLNTLVTNYETKHVADNGRGAEQRSFFFITKVYTILRFSPTTKVYTIF